MVLEDGRTYDGLTAESREKGRGSVGGYARVEDWGYVDTLTDDAPYDPWVGISERQLDRLARYCDRIRAEAAAAEGTALPDPVYYELLESMAHNGRMPTHRKQTRWGTTVSRPDNAVRAVGVQGHARDEMARSGAAA